MKDLIYQKKDILGLDIGTSAVKFVQLKNDSKLTRLVGYGRIDVPENIIIEGIITEPEKLARSLKTAFKDPKWGKISAERVIASLPESHIFTRVLELPKIQEKDINEAIRYEIDQSIPMPASDLYIDWEIISQEKEKTSIFLAAAPKSIVDSYLQLIKELDLEVLALEISLAAIARSIIGSNQKKETIIILDIGGQTSNMAVFDTSLKVTGSHPIGGSTIKKILTGMDLTENQSETVIRNAFKETDKVSGVVKEEFETLATEVVKLKDYYLEKNPNSKISKIVLCGGVAYLRGISEFFAEKTELPTVVGNPWVNISIYPLKPVPKEESPGFAAAIGLCLRGFEDE